MTTPKFQTLLLAFCLFIISAIGLIRFIGLTPIEFPVLFSSFAFFSGGVLILSARRRFLCENKKPFIKSKTLILSIIPFLVLVNSVLLYIYIFVEQPLEILFLELNKDSLGMFVLISICWTGVFFFLKHK